MNLLATRRVRDCVTLAVGLTLLGCGGGGGDDDGGGGGGIPSSTPAVVSITSTGLGAPLWSGANASPPQCPGIVLANGIVVFTFGGAVDPGTVPPVGEALGSINIVRSAGAASFPATGGFTVEDDPALPAGNARRVVFHPAPPAASGVGGGLLQGATYTVFLPAAATGGPVVFVGGQPLAQSAATCFQVCTAGGPVPCTVDLAPGSPFIVQTDPPSGTTAAAVASGSIAGNAVSISFNEPIEPATVDLASVRLVNTNSGAQVPGQLVFHQAGTPAAGAVGARVVYAASAALAPGATYEIQVAPTVTDLFGNPALVYDPSAGVPPAAQRLFATLPAPYCAKPPLVEDFSSTTRRASTSGAIAWSGNGRVESNQPLEVIGDGSFGALVIPTGPSTLDTGGMAVPGTGGQPAFDKGVWNATTFTVAAGAVVRCIGPYRVHVRCTAGATVDGTLNADAGTNANAPLGTPEQGARSGAFNNGVQATPAAPAAVAGGFGNAGGGSGGRASQADATGPQVRTPRGENGFGPRLDGQPNPGPFGSNPHYGGGDGGTGGFTYPSGGIPGEPGGLGAAGGTAFSAGGTGGPFSPLPTCAAIPVGSSAQVRALATPIPAAFVPPISIASAGSGGGGGGDRFELSGVTNDDQGAGGGAGGGGVRISCFGNLAINAGGGITARGGGGGNGSVFNAGYGGGGSGGEIWFQSFGQIAVATNATLNALGGAVGQPCGNFGAGRGGNGLVELEDADGAVNTQFLGAAPGGANVNVITFPFATAVPGTATSTFFDSGSTSPRWDAATVAANAGTAPGASVEVTFQAAHELVSGGGPDLATLTTRVLAAQIGQLDGHRFLRFFVEVRYDTPPAFPIAATLPFVDEISVAFSSPEGCP